MKAGRASAEQIAAAVEVMTTLNRAAAEAMTEVGVSGATDVTGFGLIGHLHIAVKAAGVAATIDAPAVPFLAGTAELASAGMIPGGTRSNHAFVDPHTDWGDLPELEQMMLADAQTSGGMLIAVPRERVAALRAALGARGVPASEVGGIETGPAGRIRIRGRLGRNTADGQGRSRHPDSRHYLGHPRWFATRSPGSRTRPAGCSRAPTARSSTSSP